MGAEFTVRVWPDRGGAPTAKLFETAALELKRVAAIADDANPRSEISRVNAAASKVEVTVSRELMDLLLMGQRMSTRTGGAFDITFLPLQKETERQGVDLGPDVIDDHARPISKGFIEQLGKGSVRLDPTGSRVRFMSKVVQVGVKGLAKGYAAQRVVEKLMAARVRGAAVVFENFFIASGAALQDSNLMCIESPAQNGVCAYRVSPVDSKRMFAMAVTATYDRAGHVYNPKNAARSVRSRSVTLAGLDGAYVQASAVAASVLADDQLSLLLNTRDEPKVVGATFSSNDEDAVLQGELMPLARVARTLKRSN
jgi:thiamine biosynthesis lipoprotein